MFRTLIVIAFTAATLVCLAGTVSTYRVATAPEVDLDRPGAMDALKTSNPEHYRRAQGVIDVAYHKGCHVPEFERFLRAQFDASRPYCGPIVKTSYPPQRMIRFHIDGVAYSKTIQFQVMQATPDMPARRIPLK